MKMLTAYRVELPDGRLLEGKTIPLDLVMTERHYGGVRDENKAEATFFSVMLALKRTHHVEFKDFEDFLEGVADLEIDQSGNGLGPPSERPLPDSPTAPRSRQRASSRT